MPCALPLARPSPLQVSAEYAEVAARLSRELDAQAASIWKVEHKEDPACRPFAATHWGGFLGPWKEVDTYTGTHVLS